MRLTTPGAFAIAFVLAAGIVAVNSGNNLLYLLVASLLSLFALSGLLGHLNLRAVELRLDTPDEVWAGRPASVRAQLFNHGRLPGFLLGFAGARDRGAPATDATAVLVPPRGAGGLELTLSFPVRGRHAWPPQELSSEFPFGLILRGRTLQPPGLVLVYPRPLPVSWEIVDRADREGELHPRRGAGVGGDYRGLRDYVAGDSISRVQWSAWLRLRRLQTKEFESEGAPPVVYAFDAVPGPGTEERLGQLAWLVRTALRRGRSVGLELPGCAVPPGTGPEHRRSLLAALALFGAPR